VAQLVINQAVQCCALRHDKLAEQLPPAHRFRLLRVSRDVLRRVASTIARRCRPLQLLPAALLAR